MIIRDGDARTLHLTLADSDDPVRVRSYPPRQVLDDLAASETGSLL